MYVVATIDPAQIRMFATVDKRHVLGPYECETPPSYAEAIEKVAALARKVGEGFGPKAMVIGLGGILAEDKRVIERSDIANWSGRSVAADIEKALGTLVFLEKDPVLRELAELNYGLSARGSLGALWGAMVFLRTQVTQ